MGTCGCSGPWGPDHRQLHGLGWALQGPAGAVGTLRGTSRRSCGGSDQAGVAASMNSSANSSADPGACACLTAGLTQTHRKG